MTWVITGVMGSQDGALKTEKEELKFVGEKSTNVCVWRDEACGGELCVFDDIDECIAIRVVQNMGTDLFF